MINRVNSKIRTTSDNLQWYEKCCSITHKEKSNTCGYINHVDDKRNFNGSWLMMLWLYPCDNIFIMMTSSNGNIFRITGLCVGNLPVPVNSPHKGQWRGALMFSLICVWINGWVNNREAGDLRRHRGHYDVSVMYYQDCLAANGDRCYYS